jgi:hypothetical protein
MSDKDKDRNFLAYINNPMSKESILVIYDANNVIFEKCELYSDFVQSLLRLIFDICRIPGPPLFWFSGTKSFLINEEI